MPGGPRQGQPGRNYNNRSDLQAGPRKVAKMAAPGQQYGKAAEQLRSQSAVPVQGPPAPATGAQGAPPGLAGMLSSFAPSQAPGGFGDPTARPDEPVTAGMPTGPGPGVEALPQFAQPQDDTRLMLKAIYSRFPTPEIADLIEMLDEE